MNDGEAGSSAAIHSIMYHTQYLAFSLGVSPLFSRERGRTLFATSQQAAYPLSSMHGEKIHQLPLFVTRSCLSVYRAVLILVLGVYSLFRNHVHLKGLVSLFIFWWSRSCNGDLMVLRERKQRLYQKITPVPYSYGMCRITC